MSQSEISESVAKVCRKCKVEKPLSEYGNSSLDKDGKRKKCLECSRAESREYHKKNKDKKLANLLKWRQENKEYWNAYTRNRHNPDPNFQFKGDKVEDPEGNIIKRERKFKPIDKEHVNKKARERLPRYREHNRNALRLKRQTNTEFRLASNVRARVSGAIKMMRAQKFDKSLNLIGCTVGELKNWIESHWESGMNWSNYGSGLEKWSIDHHYPCASFDLMKESEQFKCFHYTNLYPLWHVINCSKQDQIPSGPKTPEQEAFLKSHE